MPDFSSGFVVEEPAAVIPWRISEPELIALVGTGSLHEVKRGYHATSGVALGGLRLGLGFHFAEPGGWLYEVEVWRRFAKPIADSYPEFQRHLEQLFGPPTTTSDGDAGYQHHDWRKPGFRVIHYVIDRFGPEEHVRFSGR